MLNARLYRAALVPFLLALAIAAFSLEGRPPPLSSTFSPDAFQGRQAFSEMRSLARRFPDRRPGSSGDKALGRTVASTIEGLGGTAGGGFAVRLREGEGQTIDGSRPLLLVIAERPGSTNAAPILIVAHRDAAGRGAQAEMSATAVLLELARVFAERETKRTIVLASTSGGSGGASGAAQLAGDLHVAPDAAIVLGDLASARSRKPMVIPFSDAFGSASLQLQRTVGGAVTQETGTDPGTPSVYGQLAHLAFPLAPGEQGVLDAAGIPAVLLQASGEHGPSPLQAVGEERLEGLGRSVVIAVDALDSAPEIAQATQTGVVLQQKVLPEWAVRLLVLTALLGPLLLAADGLARLRRRRVPVGRWVLWTLSCALPFLCCAVFAYLLGSLGILSSTPSIPVLGGALPFDGTAATVVAALLLTFVLAWLLWVMLAGRLGWGTRPDGDSAGLAVLLILVPLGLVVWARDPYTALMLVPATHLWLLLASPELRPRRAGSVALLAGGVLPLGLLLAFYADQFGLGAGGVAWMGVLLIAGGHVGLSAALLWSIALGCLAAAGMLVARALPPSPGPHGPGPAEVSIRGPLSYAGPGSLGGTESALRR